MTIRELMNQPGEYGSTLNRGSAGPEAPYLASLSSEELQLACDSGLTFEEYFGFQPK
jgi:hypothetical protein